MTGTAGIRPQRWERGGRVVATDALLIDADAVHRYLAAGRQSPGIPVEVVRAFIANSVNFGLFDGRPESGAPMIGYARVVTDFAAFAYLGDVFLAEDADRGQGWGSWLMDCVFAHPALQGLRRWMLMCGEERISWYERYGFARPSGTGVALHRTDRGIYLRAAAASADQGRGEGEGE